MKADPLKDFLLTKEQLNLHQVVIDYLVQLRKNQQQTIKNQAPNLILKKYNLFLSLILTLAITVLNFDQLFTKVEAPLQIAMLNNYDQVEKKVQYVFQHTIMKYTILYPMKLIQCRSYIPFINSDTLCSEKSIDVKAKLVYQIGFKPNYEKLTYSPQNNSISGEWGPLQILSVTEDHEIQTQNNGLFNDWSVLQFQTKYQNKINALEQKFQQKVNQYIENVTSNQNTLQKLQKNIKNSLVKIITDGKGQRKSLSGRILNSLNKGFDKLLIFLSLDPLLPPEQKILKDEFSPQLATQFYKEEIFVEQEQIDSQQTSITEVKDSNDAKNHHQVIKDELTIKKQVQAYNSDEIRQKYNALLKKVK